MMSWNSKRNRCQLVSALCCPKAYLRMFSQCSRIRLKVSVMKSAGREKEGQQAHPATAGLVSAAVAGHPCMLMEIAGQGLQGLSACSARSHTSSQDWPSSYLFPPRLSQRTDAQTSIRTMRDRTGWRCCQEGKGLFWGPLDISPERAALGKIYLTVLPQTPVRGASLDRGPPSHQRSISL